ncbi:hypothetical protein BGZ61DRAFT_536020 [Ilyonectria robusta]|uniref:uncharacterized protein n=1 Tax=Ilyonectria robusta TaxID=1079257 RepID=UPI001E8D78A9|nr:uncharacterized protein BGZ61DRAFT_536020 [Ilyonectria robusta]KAH8677074.1 hypothetical protein BGZ61DRAFT_536020 [Ilyonectria robusta]
MDTRNRRKRADLPASAPDPPRTRRATRTRQTATPSATNPEPAQAQAARGQTSVPTPEDSKPKGLLSNPVPRRGARVVGRAASVASIVTNPHRGVDEESELGENDQISELGTEDPVVAGTIEEEEEQDDIDPEAEATRYKIMEQLFPDLINTTEELMKRFENANYDDPVFRGLVAVKRSAFVGARQVFEEKRTSPFIDWAQAHEIFKNEDVIAAAATAMVRANIVTALDEVLNLEAGQQLDPFPLLNKLNSYFPSLFIISREMFQHTQLTLDIRTWYLIEVINSQVEKPDFFKIIADIFCEPDDSQTYLQRFVRGPFKSLGEDSDENIEELCSDRITKLILIIKKDKKTYGAGQLKELFPLVRLLDDLKTWLIDMYAMLGEQYSQSQPKQESGREEFVDAEEEIADSQTDAASESQPIVRAAAISQAEPSLFVPDAPFNYLNRQERTNSMAPPSNQQQVAPRPGAPRDYREHTNADLLASPLPASSALVLERDQIKSSGSASRRPKARDPFVSQSQDEDEEEDEFETDTRPVDKGKRAAISESMPPPKRPRVAPTEPPPTASIASHVRSTLPRAPHSSQVPQPTQADLETLKRAKIEVSQRARYQLTSSAKQRHVWSHHDCALLIQLIRERHAAWATMEHNDNDKFEHPRNQQAYRDKARNMKVDYLMTDAIMPPCFDLVALGKKEIDRLISLGKNPYRKESDIDADGQAVNTEYIGSP